MRIRRALATAAATAALAGGLAAAPASADNSGEISAAITCSGWGTNYNFNDWDEVKPGISAPIRTGPYRECDPVVTLGSGYTMDTSCYVTNDYGNTWSFAHFRAANGNRYYGWIYDGNLVYNGNANRC